MPVTQLIHYLQTKLGLSHLNPNQANAEVCFANEPGLRAEYRQSFTNADLQRYINAVNNPAYREKYRDLLLIDSEVAYPANALVFWELVELDIA
jgi:hypothetical protein